MCRRQRGEIRIMEKEVGCRRQEESYCGEEGWVQETKRRYIMEKEVVCRRQEERYNGEGIWV
jgi:hypothetical protein